MSILSRYNPFQSVWAYFVHLFSNLISHCLSARSWLLGIDEGETHDKEASQRPVIDRYQPPQEPTPEPRHNVEYKVVIPKGELLGHGISGWVWLLPSGQVLKSPDVGSNEADSRRDLAAEARIYQHLGPHPRLVRTFGFTPDDGLLLEYMPHGSLKDHLRAQDSAIATAQRLRWACDAAAGLHVLHAAGVIHCDTKPRNFLLDADLRLRIADFGGSSLEGSRSSAYEAERFRLPRDWQEPSTVRSDLFALGSTIYEIMTGRSPYEDVPSREVQPLYKAQDFPDTSSILCGECIQRCWRGTISSAQEVHDLIKDIAAETSCTGRDPP